MKKILFLCDGDNFPTGAFRFIQSMRENEPIFVKGIFFTPIDFEQMISVSYMPVSEPWVKLKEDEKRAIRKAEDKFIESCKDAGIKYKIHKNKDEWDKEIFVKESRFADLVIMSSELFCSDIYNKQPNFYMQEALRGAECPVLMVPESFKKVDNLAFAYDGKKDSMHALKQFCYLFPQYTDLQAEFVYMKEEEKDDIPHVALLKEYTSSHFNSLGTLKLHFDGRKYFSTWAEDKKNPLIVSGSYARSSVSNLLKPSFIDQIIRDHESPVFIAHYS